MNDVDYLVAGRRASNIAYLRTFYFSFVFAAGLFQIFFNFDFDQDFLITLLVVASCVLFGFFVFDIDVWQKAPVPALMVFFYNISSLSGALIIKSLEGSSISSDLLMPLQTFSLLCFVQVVNVFLLILYVRLDFFRGISQLILKRVWDPIGLFSVPSNRVLWIMGFVGLFFTILVGDKLGEGTAGLFEKVLVSFQFLIYSPMLIPFMGQGVRDVSKDKLNIGILVYFFLLIVVGAIKNTRAIFVDGLMVMLCVYLLAFSVDAKKLDWLNFERALIICVLGLLGYIFLSRVALAMVAVRQYRGVVDIFSLASLTLEAFFNTDWLNAYKDTAEVVGVTVGDYSESYVESRLLSRLIMVKFHDNIMYYMSQLSDLAMRELLDYQWDVVVSILPAPVLDILSVELDKEAIRQSFGDYVVYLVDGWGLSGFKTGSMLVGAHFLFGFLFLPFLILITILMYTFYGSFSRDDGRHSPVMLLFLWNLVGTLAAFGFSSESIPALLLGFFRTVPQDIFIYLLSFSLIKFFVGSK